MLLDPFLILYNLSILGNQPTNSSSGKSSMNNGSFLKHSLLIDTSSRRNYVFRSYFFLYNLSISGTGCSDGLKNCCKTFLPDQRYYLFHTSRQLNLSRCAMHILPLFHYLTTIPFLPAGKRIVIR